MFLALGSSLIFSFEKWVLFRFVFLALFVFSFVRNG